MEGMSVTSACRVPSLRRVMSVPRMEVGASSRPPLLVYPPPAPPPPRHGQGLRGWVGTVQWGRGGHCVGRMLSLTS